MVQLSPVGNVENIWSHFLFLVLHMYGKWLGDQCWAMLWAIIIRAHDAWCSWTSNENKMNRWTDVYGLHFLSSCLHDYTCVAENMDLLREVCDSARLSPAVRLCMTLTGLQRLRTHFLNQPMGSYTSTVCFISTKVRTVLWGFFCTW